MDGYILCSSIPIRASYLFGVVEASFVNSLLGIALHVAYFSGMYNFSTLWGHKVAAGPNM